MEVERDTMQALSFVGVGLIALGWGFLTMQSLDDDDGIYEVDENQPQVSIPTPQQASLLERVQKKGEEISEDMDEIEEVLEIVEEKFKGIPEPVTRQSEEVTEDMEKVEEVPKVVEQVLLPMPETIETSHEFEIRLPPGKLEAVLKSIDSTPHDGYKPVISFNSSGQIVIDWVGI